MSPQLASKGNQSKDTRKRNYQMAKLSQRLSKVGNVDNLLSSQKNLVIVIITFLFQFPICPWYNGLFYFSPTVKPRDASAFQSHGTFQNVDTRGRGIHRGFPKRGGSSFNQPAYVGRTGQPQQQAGRDRSRFHQQFQQPEGRGRGRGRDYQPEHHEESGRGRGLPYSNATKRGQSNKTRGNSRGKIPPGQ